MCYLFVELRPFLASLYTESNSKNRNNTANTIATGINSNHSINSKPTITNSIKPYNKVATATKVNTVSNTSNNTDNKSCNDTNRNNSNNTDIDTDNNTDSNSGITVSLNCF